MAAHGDAVLGAELGRLQPASDAAAIGGIGLQVAQLGPAPGVLKLFDCVQVLAYGQWDAGGLGDAPIGLEIVGDCGLNLTAYGGFWFGLSLRSPSVK